MPIRVTCGCGSWLQFAAASSIDEKTNTFKNWLNEHQPCLSQAGSTERDTAQAHEGDAR